MDSASPTLLSRARQGQPFAIATLVHQNLDSEEIDVTAWKKQGLLHIDLMSFERLRKAEMLPTIRQTLAESAPEGIRAIKISSYIYGEEMPCWMERLGAVADLTSLATTAPPGLALPNTIGLARPLSERLAVRLRGMMFGRHRRRFATGAIASLALVAAALSISLQSNSVGPSFANQQDESQPIKTRRAESLEKQTSPLEEADDVSSQQEVSTPLVDAE